MALKPLPCTSPLSGVPSAQTGFATANCGEVVLSRPRATSTTCHQQHILDTSHVR